jgi:general stress protein 26
MSTENVLSLLAGARRVISGVRVCWLITHGERQAVFVRPMGRLLDATDWSIRFVTDRRSRKVVNLRQCANVELIFQDSHAEAFVLVSGAARILESAVEIERFWKESFRVYFPSKEDQGNVVFVEVNANRMDLWIRGVTPEPFGLAPTVLKRRETDGSWTSCSSEAGP